MVRYGVVLGYGVFSPRNVEYKKYLDKVARFIKTKRINHIVVCGSYTNPDIPHESEASSLKKYFDKALRNKIEISVESKSFTTAQSIEFARDFITLKKTNRIWVFCDNVRPFKVMWCILHYWFGLSKEEVEDFFMAYSRQFYKKRMTTETLGKYYMVGLSHLNVSVIPLLLREGMEAAVSQIPGSLLEINSLYDKKLHKKLMDATMVKFGLKKFN